MNAKILYFSLIFFGLKLYFFSFFAGKKFIFFSITLTIDNYIS